MPEAQYNFSLSLQRAWICTSQTRQGMQILVRECWNQKGLNNTALSEVMKPRASFPAVLTNFPPTNENMAKAMWSLIKSPIGDTSAKAPCAVSAGCMLVGFDIPAKFLFIHITRSCYRPNLLLAENSAALPKWMEMSRAFLLAFHGRQAEEKLSPPSLPVHVPLLLSSCSSFILQRSYLTAHKRQQKFLTKISDFTAIFFPAEHCHLSKSTAGSTVWIWSPSSTKPTAPAAVKDLLSLQDSSGQEAWNWIIRVKEKGKSNRVEPGPPGVKACSKMPLSFWTGKVKCSPLKKAR